MKHTRAMWCGVLHNICQNSRPATCSTTQVASPPQDETPDGPLLQRGQRVFEDYVIVGLLGHGGMGEVYRARHVHPLKPDIAVKVSLGDFPMSPERDLLAAITKVGIPRCVRLIDFGFLWSASRGGALPALAMSLAKGESLEAATRTKALYMTSVIETFEQQLRVVARIHDEGLVHRDIKPQNILVAGLDGPGDDAHGCSLVESTLIDFGLGARIGSDLVPNESGLIACTVPYFAPELIRELSAYSRATLDTRQDIFSCGMSLLAALSSGRVRYSDRDHKHLEQRLKETQRLALAPKLLLDHPRLADVVFKATRWNPEDRYASALEMLKDLRRARLDVEEDAVVGLGCEFVNLNELREPLEKRPRQIFMLPRTGQVEDTKVYAQTERTGFVDAEPYCPTFDSKPTKHPENQTLFSKLREYITDWIDFG